MFTEIIAILTIFIYQVGLSLFRSSNFCEWHCEKYRNFTWFTGVDILRKGTVSAQFARNYAKTVPFRKISTPGSQVKLRYFSQCDVFKVLSRLVLWPDLNQNSEEETGVKFRFCSHSGEGMFLTHQNKTFLTPNRLKIFRSTFANADEIYRVTFLKTIDHSIIASLLKAALFWDEGMELKFSPVEHLDKKRRFAKSIDHLSGLYFPRLSVN